MNCLQCKKFLGDIEPVEMDDPVEEYKHFCSNNCLTNYVIDEFENGCKRTPPPLDDGAGFEQFREDLEIEAALDAGYEPT